MRKLKEPVLHHADPKPEAPAETKPDPFDREIEKAETEHEEAAAKVRDRIDGKRTRTVKEAKAPDADAEAKETAAKLADAIENGDREAARAAARAAVFESVNAPKERPMAPAMERIVVSAFGGNDLDLAKEQKELEAALDTSTDVGRQAHALERAETNARRAFRLLISYREMYAAWEADNAVFFGAMWSEAQKALQAEKDNGKRSKQITDRDVEMMAAVTFPDEWRAQEIKRLRAKQTEKSLEHLVEMWSSKCRSLNALVGKGR